MKESTQVGGTHYEKLAIDPFEYGYRNNLDPLSFTAIKYITRFRDKNGREDLKKVIHYAILALKYDYGYKQEDVERFLKEKFISQEKGSQTRENPLRG